MIFSSAARSGSPQACSQEPPIAPDPQRGSATVRQEDPGWPLHSCMSEAQQAIYEHRLFSVGGRCSAGHKELAIWLYGEQQVGVAPATGEAHRREPAALGAQGRIRARPTTRAENTDNQGHRPRGSRRRANRDRRSHRRPGDRPARPLQLRRDTHPSAGPRRDIPRRALQHDHRTRRTGTRTRAMGPRRSQAPTSRPFARSSPNRLRATSSAPLPNGHLHRATLPRRDDQRRRGALPLSRDRPPVRRQRPARRVRPSRLADPRGPIYSPAAGSSTTPCLCSPSTPRELPA